jgi:DNA-directed RNA polymerase specialized sigma24 family protein
MSASTSSISTWIDQVKVGDEQAAQKIWERFFERLVRLSRKKLQGAPRAAADEDDVVLSAFDSFFRGATRGRFPRLADRDDLWQVLVLITERKAIDLKQHERRQKRGGGKVRHFGQAAGGDASTDAVLLPQPPDLMPTPEFAVEAAEQCQRLMERLDNETLRSVAMWKLEGYTSDEIADKLGCVARTVERKLRMIRALWLEDVQ